MLAQCGKKHVILQQIVYKVHISVFFFTTLDTLPCHVNYPVFSIGEKRGNTMNSSWKQRAVIEFLVKLGEASPTNIHQKVLPVYQEETMTVANVRRWVMRFKTTKPTSATNPDLEGRHERISS